MKLAYGTYAMPTVPLEEALPALARLGYDGVEICISPRHAGATPEEMDAARRRGLRNLLAAHNLGVPALFVLGGVYTSDAEAHQANLERARVCAQLARDLGLPSPPVLATGLGGGKNDWDAIRRPLVDLLGDYAEVACQEDFVLAGEAHCGAAVDRSERITWLFDTVNDPRIRFHFDIVHLFLAGEPIEEAVATLLPYTAHTHVTDARRYEDDRFELVLPGQGDLDIVEYVRAMSDGGWDSFITLEVSAMVWSREDYEPMRAAEECYEVLTAAFERAGVTRG